ncbi:SPOR domain-containing protein [Shewanella avicenniae]|uniref:SPOR domain-containing protein n=1 Tax=Shewanella avicenniae TaxID=2814294 RepID=A0ABX7QVX0_9GAMM|nr:SPOR domain-containing protein [Shewanella avicenniae]QSX34978.1 SPOR domain-containing protein [Shewanella avicenniae]
MATQFHNRLVGTIVIAALGVIFLPDILDGKKTLKPEQFAEIPLRPEVAEVNQDTQVFQVLDTPQSIEPQSTDDEAYSQTGAADAQPVTEVASANPPSHTEPATVEQPSAKPSASSAKVEPVKPAAANAQVAWTMQLGAFSSVTNVKGLVAKLQKAGFAAYTLPNKPVEGKLTRVFVGPEVSLDKLRSQQQKVESLTSLKGKVIRFDPLEH